jgi:DNA modification methylase
MLRPIRNNSVRGDAVYEPFAGSGTTIIAAERSGRRCLGLELDPGYCDVIVERWQAATGKEATLDGEGRTFDEVAQERRLVRAA